MDFLVLQRAVGNRALSRLLAPEADHQRLANSVPRSGGSPLTAALRREYEEGYGADFSSVRVHTDAAAGSSARAWSATAYTVGEHIVFAPGAFSPGTTAGRRLLAHELAHVVQQRKGHVTGTQLAGTSLRRSEPGDHFERAADAAADAFLAGVPHPLGGGSLARPSTTPAVVLQGEWTKSEKAEAEHWRVSNRSRFKKVSKAGLANFARAVVSTYAPESQWKVDTSRFERRPLGETWFADKPYMVDYQVQVSMSPRKGKFEKLIHAIGFGSDWASDVSGDFGTGGVNVTGLGLDTAHNFALKGAAAFATHSMKKNVKQTAAEGGVGKFAFRSLFEKSIKAKVDFTMWQLGAAEPLVLGDIRYSFVEAQKLGKSNRETNGVLRVRSGTVKEVKPGEELDVSTQSEYVTWLSALMGEDRVFAID